MLRYCHYWATRFPEKNGSRTGNGYPVDISLNLVTIILSIVLIAVILLQTKGSSFSGAFGSGSDSIQRTRRGFEKTLFQFTVGIAILFVVLAIISSILLS